MTTRERQLKAGTRVRLRAPSHVLEVVGEEGRLGTVVRPDEWEDYYIIRLDRPARYRHADGRLEELMEIREDIENMDILSQEQ